jgi:hypothetical protein
LGDRGPLRLQPGGARLRGRLRPLPPGPLEALDSLRRAEPGPGALGLPPRHRAQALHAQAGHGGSPNALRRRRRDPPPHLPLGLRRRERPLLRGRLPRPPARARGLLLTFLSGYVDENDLCFEGGFPGPLRELAGVWAEELDPVWKGQSNSALPVPGAAPWLSGEYGIEDICELINPIAGSASSGASGGASGGPEVLATYGHDWYAGRPLLTRNRRGKGRVYYLAAKTDDRFVDDLVGAIARELELKSAWPKSLPKGVQAQARQNGEDEYVFLMNFNAKEAAGLPPYGCRIEKRRIE